MKRKCIKCDKVFGESGDKHNGSVTGGICLDCMIDYLEYRIAYLKSKPRTDEINRKLNETKKRLTLSLIKRQEGDK